MVLGTFRGGTSLRIVARALSRHRRDPFDVIISGVASPMGVVGAALARCLRRPLVVLALGEDAAADVFVMVSRPGTQTEVEGFGLVYLEASASGLPCVAGNLGGCPDAVIDGVTGL